MSRRSAREAVARLGRLSVPSRAVGVELIVDEFRVVVGSGMVAVADTALVGGGTAGVDPHPGRVAGDGEAKSLVR